MSEASPGGETDQGADDRVVAERAARPVAGGPAAAIRKTLFKLPGSREQVPATEAVEADLSDITATTVMLDRSGAERITAERVSMERSGARIIDAKSAQLDRSGVVALGSDHTVLLNSSAIQVVAEEARITRSRAIWISTERATIQDSSMVIFSGTAEGDIRTAFTPRTAALFGGACGLAIVAFNALLRGTTRRGR
jgi:hypothetical protein